MVLGSKTHTSVLLLTIAATAGCGYNQPSRFQFFLPPAPKGGPAVDLPDPPSPEVNLFLKSDLPAILVPKLPPPARRTQADSLMQRAERRFQSGKRYYQAKDL